VRIVQWSDEPRGSDVLYVLEGSNRVPPGARVEVVIKGASGQPAIQLVSFPAGG
jgi:hypothetical protein